MHTRSYQLVRCRSLFKYICEEIVACKRTEISIDINCYFITYHKSIWDKFNFAATWKDFMCEKNNIN